MELKEFVQNTLVSIAEGVQEASKIWKTKSEHKDERFIIVDMGNIKEGNVINFDVAITTSSEKSGNMKGGGKILVAELGLGGESKQSTENVSRVKFKVYYGG